MASEKMKRKRNLTILRFALKRILDSHPRTLSLLSIGKDIDGYILPNSCPESIRRMVDRLTEKGHLVAVGRKYEAYNLDYLKFLLTKDAETDLILLSCTDLRLNEESRS